VRLGRQSGAVTAFIDSSTGETLLRFEVSKDNVNLTAFHLYGLKGDLIADSEGLKSLPDGLTVHDADGEVLLFVPASREENIQYRLYDTWAVC
jgi:hypothetical protein